MSKLNWLILFLSSLVYPLTARVIGAPQMISQPVSSSFPCSPLPSGTWWIPGLCIPWCCLPTTFLNLPCFPSPLHCALYDGFGQTWWMGDMTTPLQSASLYDEQEIFMWSDCLLDLDKDFLVGNMIFVWDIRSLFLYNPTHKNTHTHTKPCPHRL